MRMDMSKRQQYQRDVCHCDICDMLDYLRVDVYDV